MKYLTYFQFREARGFFGHKGRPGYEGGSLPASSGDLSQLSPEERTRIESTGWTDFSYMPTDEKDKQAKHRLEKLSQSLSSDYEISMDKEGIRISTKDTGESGDFKSYKDALDWLKKQGEDIEDLITEKK